MIARPTVMDKRWQDWTDKLLALPARENMGEQKAETFMICMLKEQQEKELPKEAQQLFQYKVGAAHARRIGLSIRPWTLLFVSSLVDSPGKLVMYLHGLRRWQQLNFGRDIDMVRLGTVFPFGFPTDEALHSLWDEQKLTKEDRELGLQGPGDNYLDLVIDPTAKEEHDGADQA